MSALLETLAGWLSRDHQRNAAFMLLLVVAALALLGMVRRGAQLTAGSSNKWQRNGRTLVRVLFRIAATFISLGVVLCFMQAFGTGAEVVYAITALTIILTISGIVGQVIAWWYKQWAQVGLWAFAWIAATTLLAFALGRIADPVFIEINSWLIELLAILVLVGAVALVGVGVNWMMRGVLQGKKKPVPVTQRRQGDQPVNQTVLTGTIDS